MLQSKPKLQIQGGGFRNLTDYEIRDAELWVEATGATASCSYISPQGFFGTTFPLRSCQQLPVVVTWIYRGKPCKSGPFVFPMLEPVPDEPVLAVVRFHADGTTTAEFIPVSKIPPRYLR
ncbi:hypothetical protein [Pontiella sulfatireligans]|uniref:Uncharacterized protein n=1 Tax=Pontiella sulfatireligans TaxID=2750658 RepID=A0A6C2UQ59_9BACT|nr:hypothetical protein [Pontiella sulfatireligans]VGO22348.1 hypothetical protein SCARR_04431 [Pontiella sulfatireligans]